MFIKIPKFFALPAFHIRWFCGKTTFWRITLKPCLLAPAYDLHDWDRQGQRWLLYIPAYSTAGLGQKAGGSVLPRPLVRLTLLSPIRQDAHADGAKRPEVEKLIIVPIWRWLFQSATHCILMCLNHSKLSI